MVICSRQTDPVLPLSTQIPQDLADLLSLLPIEHPLAILWYNHNVILAVPLHMGLPCSISKAGQSFMTILLGLSPGLPQEDRLLFSQEMAEPDEFSPAEPWITSDLVLVVGVIMVMFDLAGVLLPVNGDDQLGSASLGIQILGKVFLLRNKPR